MAPRSRSARRDFTKSLRRGSLSSRGSCRARLSFRGMDLLGHPVYLVVAGLGVALVALVALAISAWWLRPERTIERKIGR